MTPILLVTVDTEEEFDWTGPFSPANRSVGHIARLGRVQELFERYGVRPTYLVDHPVAATEQSVRVLDGFLQRGACEVGAHLHPWVNPPLVEECCPRNSYLSNLPLSLQQEKVAELTGVIRRAFGAAPASFRAGRYGLDFAVLPTLEELGYRVDTSVRPLTSFADEGGPSFVEFGLTPFWLDTGSPRPLLEVPCGVGFTHRPFAWWAAARRRLSRKPWNWFRPVAVLDRLGLLRRVALTPEGYGLPDLVRLLRALAREPWPVLNLSFHSPSVEPGHTPYVRSEAELERFLAVLGGVLEFAVERLGARCLTLGEFQAAFPAAGPSRRLPAAGGRHAEHALRGTANPVGHAPHAELPARPGVN